MHLSYASVLCILYAFYASLSYDSYDSYILLNSSLNSSLEFYECFHDFFLICKDDASYASYDFFSVLDEAASERQVDQRHWAKVVEQRHVPREMKGDMRIRRGRKKEIDM